ncbi:hypothetical protein DNU06_03295 [Putridiphycobacter roseus]|uniref:Secretion system C-terminal sorting domain-containing protein n=1 Tax=Putridiphycobacter roseus TaxID=2219161 RepID=A0A2W1N2H3_9FLAO|nr:T9SS type A sorting domain-containing protein [Putridiphycobacter roseus]PZE18869.1 hypothetical protein DNU06_03295 [Putridiphycobacter roseus]
MKNLAFLFFAVGLSYLGNTQNISTVSPNNGLRGTYTLPVTISGTNTHFSAATNTVARFSQGTNTLQILSVTAVTNTQINLNLSIPNNANLGAYQVEVYDSTQTNYLSLGNGFTVYPNNQPPSLNTITPNVAAINQTLPITISTANTNFSQATDNFIYLVQGSNNLLFPQTAVTALNDNYIKGTFNINYPGIAVGDNLSVFYGNSFDGTFYESNAITIAESTAIDGIVNYTGTFNGVVELYHQNNNVSPATYTLIADAIVSPNNAYSFSPIAEASYLLRAVPSNMTDVVATYYPNNIAWQNATVIATDPLVTTNTYDISPFLSINLTGSGTVNGTLGYGPNGFTKANTVLAEGVEVFLKGETNSIYAQAETDVNGLYSFDHVPDGNYSILINIPGYEQISSYDFVVNATDNSFNGLDFLIDDGEIFKSAFLATKKYDQTTLTVYPNPTTGKISIELPNELSKFTANVYSQLGQVVWSQTFDNHQSNVLNADLSDLPNGIYYVKLQADNAAYHLKIVKQ